MKPGKQGFDSERSRGVGGKSLTWNAVALRFGHAISKARTFEGAGEDWPVDYAEMAPGIHVIEREVGVCGNRDGLEDLPDGEFLPPVPMKCTDAIVKGAAKLGDQSDPRPQGHARRARCTAGPPATSAATAWPAAMWSPSTTRPTSTSRPR